MPALADRGYTLSRSLGLLVWGYVFWLLASLGVIKNDVGGLLLGLLVLIALSGWVLRHNGVNTVWKWINENRRLVFSVEILYLVAFVAWVIVRTANPEILGTEKPMELAFINSILRSPIFPPHDPWLAGYGISYYYFGYVMTAMMAKLTATQGSVAFNLAISQTFALVAIAAYGILYSLLAAMKARVKDYSPSGRNQNLLLSLLGPTFILLVSNLEGFLEVLHARGLFWVQDAAGTWTSNFWTWLDMKELSQPPSLPLSWFPSRYLWWWRASRVIQDYDLAGTWREVIDEFPFFSFLLGDLHPHVLAMPFALLAVGLGLNLYLGGARGITRWLWLELPVDWRTFWLASLIIGGLAFLNTWDFPMYVFFFSLIYLGWRLVAGKKNDRSEPELIDQDLDLEPGAQQNDSLWRLVKEFLGFAFPLTVSGILVYLPFYFGFSSQAGGILPNFAFSTRGVHLWVMFGSLLLPIFAYLIFIRSQYRASINLGTGFLISGVFILLVGLISFGFGIGIANIPLLGDIYLSTMGGLSSSSVLSASLTRRVNGSGWITLFLLLALTCGYLWGMVKTKIKPRTGLLPGEDQDVPVATEPPGKLESFPHDFVVILITMGSLLVLFVEFFYLRDQFGSRMNTIFKFYYQTWLFWGLSAAFASAVLLKRLQGIWNILFRIGFILLLAAALTYPFLSLWTKTSGFDPPSGFTLDGTAYMERNSTDEMAAIRWIENSPDGVVLEAVGPQYSEFARVATNSGQPNVLGWAGHESQWRGGRREIGTREEDIEAIYSSNNWEQTKLLLDMYDVRYIFIGDLERRVYRINEAKFERFLGEPAFAAGQVSVYEVPRELQTY